MSTEFEDVVTKQRAEYRKLGQGLRLFVDHRYDHRYADVEYDCKRVYLLTLALTYHQHCRRPRLWG